MWDFELTLAKHIFLHRILRSLRGNRLDTLYELSIFLGFAPGNVVSSVSISCLVPKNRRFAKIVLHVQNEACVIQTCVSTSDALGRLACQFNSLFFT